MRRTAIGVVHFLTRRDSGGKGGGKNRKMKSIIIEAYPLDA